MQQNNSGSPDNQHEDILPEVQQELSKVAANPKQNIIILAIICAIIVYIIIHFFLNNVNKEIKPQAPTEVTKPNQNSLNDPPPIPQLPEPPKLVEPTIPSLPRAEVPVAKIAEPIALPTPLPIDNHPSLPTSEESALPKKGQQNNDDEKKRKDAKRKSSIVLVSKSQTQKTTEQIALEADFKKRGNMELLLGRGKLIDAVLESAVSTDFGGEIRALVSRDVFSESGKNILIPKGSRVFGSYATSTTNSTYGRISVLWNRIDLASGYSVNIQSPGVDALGKIGLEGETDNKFKERFSNAILMSAFNIEFANLLDKVVAPPVTSQTAATNNAAASQLNNIALAIFNSTNDASTKIQLICSNVQTAVPDKTSAAYNTFATACFNINVNSASATPDQNLTSLMSSVNSLASGLLTTNAALATPTQTQNASKQAFTDVTNTVKDMFNQQHFSPTTTIDQGTPIKIYVNKDYQFPAEAVNRIKIVQ